MAFFINDRGSERRQFRRIKTSSPIEYRFINSGRFTNSVTCDISEGGISFIVDGPVPIGTHLHFQVILRNRPQPIYISWATKEPYSSRYRIGLEFTQENKVPCYNS